MGKRFFLKRVTDVDKVIEIFFTISPEDDWPGRETSLYWILYDKDKPCGVSIATPIDKNVLYAAFGGLTRSARGKKLHRRLIAVRERYGRANGFTKLITYTLTTNGPSIYNLLKNGYKIYDPQNPYQGTDVVYFIKDL